jgi:predicted phage terminase large subunit-like protein
VSDTSDIQRKLNAAKRLIAIREARDDLLRFMRLIHPDPNDPENPDASTYQITPQARLLCQVIEKVEARKLMRVAVSISPQMGKSEILTRGGPAWISGRDPRRHIMVGSYNSELASDFGADVRSIMTSAAYSQVFPEHALARGGSAKDMLITESGGKLAFVGVGGSGTGKPADFFVIDDPIRNSEDAASQVYRDKIWKWLNSVAFTRLHGRSPICIVMTRWSLDDMIGRLCDPNHPERNKAYAGIAENWTYINIPAVVTDPKLAQALGLELEVPTDPKVIEQFGAKPMASLWEDRFPLTFLAETRKMDPGGFEALRMGRPTPDGGSYFKAEDIVEYQVGELPPMSELRVYGASDHAVSTKQDRDYTVLGCVGVDANDDIWVLPDLVWDRMDTHQTVEALLDQFKRHKPALWFMESELISKSFGPFLRKRMEEERIYTAIDDVVVSKDKPTRGRSAQGRMRMRKIRFPAYAPWFKDAKAQLLFFPAGANDDFVDWLSHIANGLTKEYRPTVKTDEKPGPRTGSIEWILQKAKERAHEDQRRQSAAGW